ncbi:MAG TPA: hypothetical protein VED40_20140 [Azospirillaceae bacterium]|nr:hypothetical protein [Azospirillaceae bacterium]
MSDIRTGMPLLARHEGEWEGVYIYIDADGKEVDRHNSHLTCKFPDGGEFDYYQINRYSWSDGRSEEHHFPAKYRDGRIWWDTERITGWAADVGLDNDKRTTMLTWTRKDMPNHYLYEMIQLSPCGTKRARTWHWFKDDELYQRTIIKERRVK